MLKLNTPAPDFNKQPAYHAGEFKEISLSEMKGKWVILFFYPRDFTFVCPTELTGFAKRSKELEDLNVLFMAASTDSVYSHKAWFEGELSEVKYPVLADTSHNLTNSYEILNDEGTAERGTFIIDPEGNLRFYLVSDSNVGRSVDETIRVIKALQSGGLCAIDWKPGDSNLAV